MPTIQVHGIRRHVDFGIGVGNRLEASYNISLIRVFVVPEVCSLGLGLVRAIRRNRCLAELHG